MKEEEPTKAKAVAWEDCQKVATWLRHRAGEELRNECDEPAVTGYVQGHVDGADRDKSELISYVALPTIYGKHADGMIRRAGMRVANLISSSCTSLRLDSYSFSSPVPSASRSADKAGGTACPTIDMNE